MSEPLHLEILDTLVCEPVSRPRGAPTIGDIVPAVRSTQRDAAYLTVTFDRTALPLVSAVVEAERLCCSTITWDLAVAQETTLRIIALPGQLDALEAIFSPPHTSARV